MPTKDGILKALSSLGQKQEVVRPTERERLSGRMESGELTRADSIRLAREEQVLGVPPLESQYTPENVRSILEIKESKKKKAEADKAMEVERKERSKDRPAYIKNLQERIKTKSELYETGDMSDAEAELLLYQINKDKQELRIQQEIQGKILKRKITPRKTEASKFDNL